MLAHDPNILCMKRGVSEELRLGREYYMNAIHMVPNSHPKCFAFGKTFHQIQNCKK